jgi:hypothetical protein
MTIHNAFRASQSPRWDAASVPPLPTRQRSPASPQPPQKPSALPRLPLSAGRPLIPTAPPSLLLSLVPLFCPPTSSVFSVLPSSSPLVLVHSVPPPTATCAGNPHSIDGQLWTGHPSPGSASQSTFAGPGCWLRRRSNDLIRSSNRTRPPTAPEAGPCGAASDSVCTPTPRANPPGEGDAYAPVVQRHASGNDSGGVPHRAPSHGHSTGRVLRDSQAPAATERLLFPGRRPRGVPFRTQHPLGAVVNRPSVWSDR